MSAYRIYFRNGKGEAVPDEAALAKALARTSKPVIYHEVAIIHRCQQCGTEGPWTPAWRSYPVLRHHPAWAQERTGDGDHYKVCSATCWDAMLPGLTPMSYVDLNSEPGRSAESLNGWYDAIRSEARRKSELTAHRKVPMPVWLGQGYCKWCNGKMTPADRPRTMWHAGCAEQWKLHALLDVQTTFVVKRDGKLCACGCGKPGTDMDHRVPLWSVRHLPDDERRPYYGPANLQWLAWDCHKAKSAREAAERAALKREGSA